MNMLKHRVLRNLIWAIEVISLLYILWNLVCAQLGKDTADYLFGNYEYGIKR